MTKFIFLLDEQKNVLCIDNNMSIGSIKSDGKLQKCSICVDGSTITNVHVCKVNLITTNSIGYYKKTHPKHFMDKTVIEIDLTDVNLGLINNIQQVDVNLLFDKTINYRIIDTL